MNSARRGLRAVGLLISPLLLGSFLSAQDGAMDGVVPQLQVERPALLHAFLHERRTARGDAEDVFGIVGFVVAAVAVVAIRQDE